MNICVIGSGYVGLVTGACFAEMGNRVWCIDNDSDKISKLNEGSIPIYEPGLEEIVKRNRKNGRLIFTTDIQEGLRDSQYSFIAVGTPSGEDGSADLSSVYEVAGLIGRYISKYMIIINKSTVPVGTGDSIRNIIDKQLKDRGALDIRFDIVSNPEFLKEGAAVEDFMRPDRIIIGADNENGANLMKQLYEPFIRNQHPIITMDIKSAEITKYAANAMLASRISFMNEIANLCDKVGADIANVRVGVGTDSRIGMSFLYSGLGYGGSCFPKDVKELIRLGERNETEMRIVKSVESVNEAQRHYFIEMIKRRFGNDLKGLFFGVWGLAFKPQTDDMREAPSVTVIRELLGMGAKIAAYDPEALEQAKLAIGDLEDIYYVNGMMDAVNSVDALLLLTEWRQFRQPDFYEMKLKMKRAIIFDGRNQYDTGKVKSMGFEYYCIGRSCHML